jgi:hypothetical protein
LWLEVRIHFVRRKAATGTPNCSENANANRLLIVGSPRRIFESVL